MTPAADFIRASTRVEAPPLVPEVRLHLADDVFGFWERIEATRGPAESPMPFWAFAWPGGQALARYLLDHPDVVAGRDVFDLASGSGIVAVAAAKAGARSVTACEIDPLAICAIDLNARLNGGGVVAFQTDVADVEIEAAEVALAGDVFYDRVLADAIYPTLQRARMAGALVLVGDPDRRYMPLTGFDALAAYDVPDAHALESTKLKRSTVWRLR